MVKYRRVLIKLSGEALGGEEGRGIDTSFLRYVAREIRKVYDLGVEVAIVIGGGNILRGSSDSQRMGIDRATSDYMGMLATLINALALQDTLERYEGIPTRILSAIEVRQVAEPYIRRRAIRHLEKGRVVIFAGGTGNPFFSTDTAAVLRSAEISADVILKATKVKGIYDKDPNLYSDAKLFERLNYMEVINKNLKVMDFTAITLCREIGKPIIVFNIKEEDNLKRIVLGERIGTLVGEF